MPLFETNMGRQVVGFPRNGSIFSTLNTNIPSKNLIEKQVTLNCHWKRLDMTSTGHYYIQ